MNSKTLMNKSKYSHSNGEIKQARASMQMENQLEKMAQLRVILGVGGQDLFCKICTSSCLAMVPFGH